MNVNTLPARAARTPVVKLCSSIPQNFVTSRAFHASLRRPIYIESIQAVHEIILAIHRHTGTPWFITIPLIATLLRTTTSLPLNIIQQRASAQRIKLIPLLQAWKHSLRKETLNEVGHLGPEVLQRTLDIKMRKKRKELFKKFNCGRWKMFLGAFPVPLSLGVLDTLRRMAGLEITAIGGLLARETMALSPNIVTKEEDFMTEGMLWFPNLTLPDPELILPFVLSGAMLANVYLSPGRTTPYSKWQIRGRKVFGVVALSVGPLFLYLPSALMLYWITGYLLSLLQSWLINRLIPLPQVIQSSTPKRPWRSGLSVGSLETRKKPPIKP